MRVNQVLEIKVICNISIGFSLHGGRGTLFNWKIVAWLGYLPSLSHNFSVNSFKIVYYTRLLPKLNELSCKI